MKQIIVTAAIIFQEEKVLLAQRKPGTQHELLWEFPGGKLEVNEAPEAGLQREIKEELALDISVREIYQVDWQQQEEQALLFLFYLCEVTGGNAQAVDCHDFRWVEIQQLAEFEFPPADQAVVAQLIDEYGQPLRSKRKQEHISQFLRLPAQQPEQPFQDIRLMACALPELALSEVVLSRELFGKLTAAPLLINAITGGSEQVEWINRALARCAKAAGLAMAVGSQTAALLEPEFRQSFRVVREENPAGIIIANVGAGVSPDAALQAVTMIEADALQVHLNVPQELAMREGERSFRGWLANITTMVQQLPVPIIVKEVGFGLSREVIRELKYRGVQHFDVGGFGGTNFISIEERRRGTAPTGLACWGIPTPCATIEAVIEGVPGELIASGGINSPLDCAKALALGATHVGVAGHFLRTLCQHSEEDLLALLEAWKAQLQQLYLMCGARNQQELATVPVIITGLTKTWLEQRGISLQQFAQRSRSSVQF